MSTRSLRFAIVLLFVGIREKLFGGRVGHVTIALAREIGNRQTGASEPKKRQATSLI